MDKPTPEVDFGAARFEDYDTHKPDVDLDAFDSDKANRLEQLRLFKQGITESHDVVFRAVVLAKEMLSRKEITQEQYNNLIDTIRYVNEANTACLPKAYEPPIIHFPKWPRETPTTTVPDFEPRWTPMKTTPPFHYDGARRNSMGNIKSSLLNEAGGTLTGGPISENH